MFQLVLRCWPLALCLHKCPAGTNSLCWSRWGYSFHATQTVYFSMRVAEVGMLWFHTCSHPNRHTHTHAYTHTHMHTHTCTHTHTHPHVYTYMHTHSHTHTHTHTCTSTLAGCHLHNPLSYFPLSHTCKHTHLQAHAYTHTYMHLLWADLCFSSFLS